MDGPTPQRVFVSPGGFFCGDHSFMVSTILGSCVAVCLWDAHLHQGGMNHFMLPRWDRSGEPLRYGDHAIPRLVEELDAMGSRLCNLTAKVFGGAAVLNVGLAGQSVGEANTALAVELVAAHGIPVASRSTGGADGYHIRFDLATGEVALRRIASTFGRMPRDSCLAERT